ncbi:cell surface glycoprotein CD200 receptor 1 [Nannospalax galili]|uniref:cell surface glycoprotein CD200 receptor 1 n=1 Tax=Nannospalax galili TaxID=1026970 RepID=UPI000819EF69|nr:cell surface glycoprotein CD200 receptor 1 [Nannospalax galili]
MFCPWRTSDLALFLVRMVFFVADSSCSCVEETQRTSNYSRSLTEVNTTEAVLMGTQALLCCPPIPTREAVLVTWKLNTRGQPSCSIAYSVGTKETNKTNCTDGRITWVFTPDKSPHLLISAVAITHDGRYMCETASPDGNFRRDYDLQVLVPPAVTLISENGTTVCEAAAGKPAAQIYWTPEGNCVTENERHSNDTVTVRSTCHWDQNNVSLLTCSVSHLTGNKTLPPGFNQGTENLRLYILYSISPVVILIIIGSICFFKIRGFRKCKLGKTEATSVVDEDEMQPYASYTEKNNPLYDTVSKVEALQMLRGEVDSTGLHTLSATGI